MEPRYKAAPQALGCSGVSVVWCSCLGGGLLDRRRGRALAAALVVAILDAAALAFYAVVAAPITSIAHACAIAASLLFRAGALKGKKGVGASFGFEPQKRRDDAG